MLNVIRIFIVNQMHNETNNPNIVEQMNTILEYVKRIDKKLDTLMDGSISLNTNNENTIVSLFPITAVQGIQNI